MVVPWSKDGHGDVVGYVHGISWDRSPRIYDQWNQWLWFCLKMMDFDRDIDGEHDDDPVDEMGYQSSSNRFT